MRKGDRFAVDDVHLIIFSVYFSFSLVIKAPTKISAALSPPSSSLTLEEGADIVAKASPWQIKKDLQ
jgi:hypothetical protein